MTLYKSLILCPLRTYNSLSESWTGTSKVMPLPEAIENAQRFVLQTFSPVRHWLKTTRLVAPMSTFSILVIFGRVFPETPKDSCIVGQLRRSSKIVYFLSCDAGIRLFIYTVVWWSFFGMSRSFPTTMNMTGPQREKSPRRIHFLSPMLLRFI